MRCERFYLILFLVTRPILVRTNSHCERIESCNSTTSAGQWIENTCSGIKQLRSLTNETRRVDPPSKNDDIPPGIYWTTDVPNLPIIFATSTNLPDGKCKNQVRRYLRDLANATLWAVQMYDASTKYPDGIIYGHTKHLGNFDQCYELRARLPGDETDPGIEEEISGRYCLIRMRYVRKGGVSVSNGPRTLTFDHNSPAREAIDDHGDFRRVRRHSIYTALCVPATCSASDVGAAITEPLTKFGDARGINLEITVNPLFFQARQDFSDSLSTGALIFCVILAGLVILVTVSSWYDSCLYTPEEAANDAGSEDIFLCFSARRNFNSIFNNSASHPGLDCIHMIRFLLMLGVMVGHRSMQYYGYPVIDATLIEQMYPKSHAMFLLNGTIIIDAFFGLGGLLLAHALLEELDRSRRLNLSGLILIRFLRLTPLYMLVVAFYATLFPYLGSGPFWKSRVGVEAEYCANNWWTNILYINNYVNPANMCMFQSWYLSVDFQLYVMGSVILWVFWKLPRKMGYPFLVLILLAGLAISFFTTYAGNLAPFFMGLPFMGNPRRDFYFNNYYIATHMRIAPYMVGILSGVIIYDHKGANWKLPRVYSRLLLVLFSAGFTITSQTGGAKYYDPNYNYQLHPIETALYASLHRAAFSLGICSIVVFVTIGEGLESYTRILTPRWVPPLARLTYGVYLLHNINQTYQVGVTRVARVFSMHSTFWDLLPDTVYSFGISLVFSIIVEGPLRKIEKLLLTKRPSRSMAHRISANTPRKVN